MNDYGVGSLSLLQGIFPNQGSNPGLLHCRQILYLGVRILASFNSCENDPVVTEDSVPVSEMRVELQEGELPHVESGVCFIPSCLGAPCMQIPWGSH